jgi:hypothetical protein
MKDPMSRNVLLYSDNCFYILLDQEYRTVEVNKKLETLIEPGTTLAKRCFTEWLPAEQKLFCRLHLPVKRYDQ